MADTDSTEPAAATDPANIAEARPDSDRGQGTLSALPSEAIAEAAAEAVDLTGDPDAEAAHQGGRSGVAAAGD